MTGALETPCGRIRLLPPSGKGREVYWRIEWYEGPHRRQTTAGRTQTTAEAKAAKVLAALDLNAVQRPWPHSATCSTLTFGGVVTTGLRITTALKGKDCPSCCLPFVKRRVMRSMDECYGAFAMPLQQNRWLTSIRVGCTRSSSGDVPMAISRGSRRNYWTSTDGSHHRRRLSSQPVPAEVEPTGKGVDTLLPPKCHRMMRFVHLQPHSRSFGRKVNFLLNWPPLAAFVWLSKWHSM